MLHLLRLPPRAFALRTAGRALLVWFLARLGATFVIHYLSGGEFEGLDPLGLPERLVLAGVAVGAATYLAHRRGELLLLGNLGVPPWTSGAAAAVPPLMAEAVLWMLLP